tara:strand:+ start:84 stop:323 length:240 start_codon:yes stop_codon:yes gene_type:complete
MYTQDTQDRVDTSKPYIVGFYFAEALGNGWHDAGYVWSDQWTPGDPTHIEEDGGPGNPIIRTIYPCAEEEAAEEIAKWH